MDHDDDDDDDDKVITKTQKITLFGKKSVFYIKSVGGMNTNNILTKTTKHKTLFLVFFCSFRQDIIIISVTEDYCGTYPKI